MGGDPTSMNLQDMVEQDIRLKKPAALIDLTIKQVQAGIPPTTNPHPNLPFANLAQVCKDGNVTIYGRRRK